MANILIVDRVHPALAEGLRARDFVCTTDMTCTYESFAARADDLFGLVIRSRFVVDRALLDTKPSLRFIVRIGSGVENIDVAYAESRGVRVISTPEGNANAVAEHCLGLLLSLLRHISSADREVRAGEWLREKNKGTELQAHTYGLIGYGHTGPAFARLLHTLGCEVYAYDRYNPAAGDECAKMVTLEELCARCDVISLHINYIPDNRHFFGDDFIARMPHPFLLINSSRGLVVDSAALVRGLQAGKVTAAALDVLEYENTRLKNLPKDEWPEAMHALAARDNVILTPHVGGQTIDAELRHARWALMKIVKLFCEDLFD
jgi:D-3-phosphoglycerate dehydrogenase